MILTDKEIVDIEIRWAQATQGPYKRGKAGGIVSNYPIEDCLGGSDEIEYYGGYLIAESITPKNGEFLAASWLDIKNLIETIRTERREWNEK